MRLLKYLLNLQKLLRKILKNELCLKGPREVSYHTVVFVTWLMVFWGVVVVELNSNGSVLY